MKKIIVKGKINKKVFNYRYTKASWFFNQILLGLSIENNHNDFIK